MLVHSGTFTLNPDETKPKVGSFKRETSSPSLSRSTEIPLNKSQKIEKERTILTLNLPNDETLTRDVSMGKLTLSLEGVGGTYLVSKNLRDKNYVAVFKPGDEEAGAPLNPKKNVTSPPRKGIKPGEGYLREVAAYMLDHSHLAGVPFTQFYEMEVSGEKKMGSLQRFVANEGSVMDFGQSLFSVMDVHRIAQLDIRLFNVDRNDENLLVNYSSGAYHLVPIDHSYSLPETLEDSPLFAWMYWKQAKEPMSEDILEYIERIDIEKDERVLRMLKIKDESITVMKMATLALKVGARSGLSFYDIALFLTRAPRKEFSPLEELVKETMARGDLERFWENFMSALTEKNE